MSKSHTPRAGESFMCAACASRSVVKCERVMDGWTCLGERLICALCAAPVPGTDIVSLGKSKEPSANEAAQQRLKALAGFLDTTPETRPVVDLSERGNFCKDCLHFLRHPFVSRCLYHERDVEPMDDCDDFVRVPPAGPDSDGGS